MYIGIQVRFLFFFYKCLVGGTPGTWHLVFLTTDFAYNNCVNMSTGKSPFVIVYGYSPCTLIDLVPLPPNAQISKAVEILPNTSMTYMLRLEGKLQ